MTPLKTVASHDVLKNPDVENDFVRFESHLDQLYPSVR